ATCTANVDMKTCMLNVVLTLPHTAGGYRDTKIAKTSTQQAPNTPKHDQTNDFGSGKSNTMITWNTTNMVMHRPQYTVRLMPSRSTRRTSMPESRLPATAAIPTVDTRPSVSTSLAWLTSSRQGFIQSDCTAKHIPALTDANRASFQNGALPRNLRVPPN